MEPPKPQESIDLTLENENKKYNLSIINSSNSLIININVCTEDNLFKKEFHKEMTLKDLSQTGKFFKLFDNIEEAMISLKETFETKKPKIKEENSYIDLKIIPILSAMGETTLIIPIKKSDDKEIISNLCEIIKNQANEIKNLNSKVSSLEIKVKKIEERIFNNLIGDIITRIDQCNLISGWINKNKKFDFKLLYKGTKDGDSYENFHNKCDNQGPTIIFIKSKDGQIFGGYTSKSLDKNNANDIPDLESFLFNVNISKKYGVSNNKGIYYNSSYILCFGGKNYYELAISKNYLQNQQSYCDNGDGFNFKNYELSGGKQSYKIEELEVYKVAEK